MSRRRPPPDRSSPRRAAETSPPPDAGSDGSKALWTIGQVQDRPIFTGAGAYVDGKDVEVIFWDGSSEHLQYAKSAYTPELVAQDAQKAADRHLRVKALQGPILPPEIISGTY